VKLTFSVRRACKSGPLALSLAVILAGACGPLASAQATTETPSNTAPLPLVAPAPASPLAQVSPADPSTVTPPTTPAHTPPRPVGGPAPAHPAHGNEHVPAAVIEGSTDVDSPSSPVSADQPEQSVLAADTEGGTAKSAASAAVPAPVTPSAAAPGGGELPFTGLPVFALLAVGAALLAGGVMLRIAKSSEHSNR
jgi:hypothetical protein